LKIGSIAAGDWLNKANDQQRSANFEVQSTSMLLDFTGLKDVSGDDPNKIFQSSGYSMDGHYEFGFGHIQTLNLFSGSITTGIVVEQDMAYFATDAKQVIALNLRDNAIKWKVETRHVVMIEPMVIGDQIFVADIEGHVIAISKQNGGVSWSISMKAAVRANLVYSAPYLVVADKSGLIQILDTTTYTKHWSYQLPSGIEGTPIIVDQKLWVASLGGVLYRFDLLTGRAELQCNLTGAVHHGMCKVESKMRPSLVVVGTDKGMLHSFDLQGQELPYSPIDLKDGALSPISGGGLVYVCHNTSFFQIDPWLGEALFEFTPSGQNFFGDLVYDGQSIHALVLLNSAAKVAKILDYQFSFRNFKGSEFSPIPRKGLAHLGWDGKIEELFWSDCLEIPFKWTDLKSPHFEKITLRIAAVKQGLMLAGEFIQGGSTKQTWEFPNEPRFEIELLQSGLSTSLFVYPSSKTDLLNIAIGNGKKVEMVACRPDASKENWSFECFVPVSKASFSKTNKMDLKASYHQPMMGLDKSVVELIFKPNLGSDPLELMMPSLEIE